MAEEKNGKENNEAMEEKAAEQNGTEPPQENGAQVSISQTELTKIKQETAEFKDKYLRQLAETENARKRLQKEKQEMIQFSTQNLISEFLHPLDHLENALRFTQDMSDEVKHWGLGFQMILSQFKDVLTNNGVTPFESKGKAFDPHLHEAVETVETDKYPPNTVVEEFIRGYKMGDRVIRPARVKVSKEVSTKENDNISQNKE